MLALLRKYASALALLAAFAAGAMVQDWYRDSVALAEKRAADEVGAKVSRDIKEIAQNWNKELAGLRKLGEAKGREIKTIVERPVYRNVCFDPDGLQIINELRPH